MKLPTERDLIAVAGIAASGLALISMLSARSARVRPTRSHLLAPGRSRSSNAATAKTARELNRAAGTLAASVLADSSVEHYRGSFKNKAMYTPLAVSALTLATSIHGTADTRPLAHKARDAAYLLAAATGLVGSGFHLYNVGKRVGGFSWQNLFYGAPIGAPMAILLSGLLGFCSERVREARRTRPRIFGLPAGRMIATVAGAGLLGTTGEAGLLHFRGAYHNPFMLLPVTLPPIGAALLLSAAGGDSGRTHRFARWWMRVLTAMGVAGVGFHAYGVSRNMGGWRNWSQNILNGPPIPAPPSFAGLALAGLAALRLMRAHPDA
ncbi:hypothetical protein [Bradyrhizobium guangzhouense]|uniref:Uncharacterized protein n=1 Tax=Bradyrhizobium guangzhouense TaxID=1325095 RepID=A0AAE5X3D0_9BRAD|nr:hypothetical protein [Bradyrhizobium guangzhouense]QAU47931.1 hypothetical protein XH91_23000 [Bradyrhizobium guangzhouense]RXH14489.1 hypothetical protein EAS56_11550 [Bradyrhizobium guangzhouense]